MRLTKRVRDGLWELITIGDTVLQHQGEGWALECCKGPDFSPCKRADCETCTDYENLSRAVEWLQGFLSKKKDKT